ncbi:hypothetical protein AUC61_09360 [Pseudomonas sp. S25]|uniref:Small integral membrane protein n=2 Tax=Pseudomonas maioricensis TaxID=1766623 RepID=A0ABS9ZGV4_9PSED|nr:hypothetical protein [Pseudomonas sp. S25]
MAFVLIFIGFLAFASGYIVSLEERLQRDGKFCPFSVRTNLQASVRARKTLTWLGMLIWAIAGACYLWGPPLEASPDDQLGGLGVIGLIFAFMYWGRAREHEFRKTGASTDSYAYQEAIEPHEWWPIAFRALVDVAKILLFLILMYGIKRLINL